ncbi:Holliday junction resolvase RecU [Lederbergia lenta]|uniref:Holliday junction resolvase RecU n=1 Tax=Lederbergia lenta TaxID=1467 RepID=A0A2X4W0J9_LEDLE|nr:Holliday junction resolvase RecU [Lederbergia lenta]MCM3109305.1 Holliday junction resolvase RecU [Lederbergia lenta]MEC2324929.1 Holliday junction resolvase RecU [Lederbergia lenta]SQI56611.1 recombination protein U [Lederbergia lenta]
MEFHYPNGRKYTLDARKKLTTPAQKKISYSKRGMALEDDINETNQYYLVNGMAVIHKKPTPIQIVEVDYKKRSTAVIKEAYFRQASTTDYNGICEGKYIDFEAKETQSTTSFPLMNFHEHQISHMQNIVQHKGIAFVILRFAKTDEVFLLECEVLFNFWERMNNGGRKSITKKEIHDFGHKINIGYHPRLDYLKILKEIYSF